MVLSHHHAMLQSDQSPDSSLTRGWPEAEDEQPPSSNSSSHLALSEAERTSSSSESTTREENPTAQVSLSVCTSNLLSATETNPPEPERQLELDHIPHEAPFVSTSSSLIILKSLSGDISARVPVLLARPPSSGKMTIIQKLASHIWSRTPTAINQSSTKPL
ncbi:hypothetical protein MJO28_015812 [Puccinia striiformis f. sp. tritici]|uniref:Uncharacterized protein n=1 Tax=Puccinia striiformis f. sp. tritici TaxID=168172 RepID=A0ACC0DPV1_9BASI|nr:hypothetical protein MJO28_015812 [Puccinia striiformis f. sp. tritici]